MLLAARQSMLTSGGPTAKSYVQDGLIAMWDGIENTGWGQHDASATEWKDLIGSRDLTCVNVSWTDTMAQFSGNGYANRNESEESSMFAQQRTMEACFRTNGGRFNGQDVVSIGTRDSGTLGWWRLCISGYSNRIIVANGRNIRPCPMYTYDDVALANGMTFSVASNTVGILGAYWNGSAATASGSDYQVGGHTGETIGAATTSKRFFTGFVGCVRCYERALTDAEVAANYAIDKIRFNLPD